ncbi:hypothetical protein EYR40_002795 [Pleurotus pulmonarius]|nr:hypothetical protein EYR40_002795 [Pleurotus pulmonarius]KAF4582354.1 hypothetical protein EYR38_002472 [Pleurotus pulmonarius]
MSYRGRKLRSGNEFSPYALDLDFAQLLERVSVPDIPNSPGPGPTSPPRLYEADTITSAIDARTFAASATPVVSSPKTHAETRKVAELETAVSASKARSYRAHKRLMAKEKQHRIRGRTASARNRRIVADSAVKHKAQLNAAELPSTQDGYTARPAPLARQDSAGGRTVEELLGEGFTLLNPLLSTPRPLVDSAGRVFAVLAGKPHDASFDGACESLYKLMDHELSAFEMKEGQTRHRRGNFPAFAVGVSYGNGQTEPSRLVAGDAGPNSEGLTRIIQSPELQRIASYGDAAFQLWAPRLHSYYRDHVERLHEALPHLRRNFRRSVFPCATLNFGPKVQTVKHRDTLNLAHGWCSITALGRFDHRKGGHIVLWDARVVIEFPSHSTILIPSATIAHSNLEIHDSECRASFTQYCAGGIFRWVDNGCRTQRDFRKADFEEYSRTMERRQTGWIEGLRLYSTLDEIILPKEQNEK